MDEYIYYVRDNDNRPMITICLLKGDDGKLARGVAICSLKETGPDKAIGRMYARGRALRAFRKAKNGNPGQSSPVNREEAYKSIMKAVRPVLPMEFYQAKCVYNPKLNRLEENLIAKQKTE